MERGESRSVDEMLAAWHAESLLSSRPYVREASLAFAMNRSLNAMIVYLQTLALSLWYSLESLISHDSVSHGSDLTLVRRRSRARRSTRPRPLAPRARTGSPPPPVPEPRSAEADPEVTASSIVHRLRDVCGGRSGWYMHRQCGARAGIYPRLTTRPTGTADRRHTETQKDVSRESSRSRWRSISLPQATVCLPGPSLRLLLDNLALKGLVKVAAQLLRRPAQQLHVLLDRRVGGL